MLKAVIFDYNGVLIDDVEAHETSYLWAGRDTGFPISRETIRKYISYDPDQKRKLYFGNIPDQQWERIFSAKTRYYFELAAIGDLVFPEVEGVLTSLSRRYTLALISNTPRHFFERVFPGPLAGLFRETLFAGEIKRPKPAPDPLLEILRRLGIRKDQCCYVGDSVLDIQMAKTAGIPIFAVATGDNSRDELEGEGADGVFEDLSVLAERLKALS